MQDQLEVIRRKEPKFKNEIVLEGSNSVDSNGFLVFPQKFAMSRNLSDLNGAFQN